LVHAQVRKAWIPKEQAPDYVNLQGRQIVEEIDLRPNAQPQTRIASTKVKKEAKPMSSAEVEEWLPVSAAAGKRKASAKVKGKKA
jgi:hypothetical protein